MVKLVIYASVLIVVAVAVVFCLAFWLLRDMDGVHAEEVDDEEVRDSRGIS